MDDIMYNIYKNEELKTIDAIKNFFHSFESLLNQMREDSKYLVNTSREPDIPSACRYKSGKTSDNIIDTSQIPYVDELMPLDYGCQNFSEKNMKLWLNRDSNDHQRNQSAPCMELSISLCEKNSGINDSESFKSYRDNEHSISICHGFQNSDEKNFNESEGNSDKAIIIRLYKILDQAQNLNSRIGVLKEKLAPQVSFSKLFHVINKLHSFNQYAIQAVSRFSAPSSTSKLLNFNKKKCNEDSSEPSNFSNSNSVLIGGNRVHNRLPKKCNKHKNESKRLETYSTLNSHDLSVKKSLNPANKNLDMKSSENHVAALSRARINFLNIFGQNDSDKLSTRNKASNLSFFKPSLSIEEKQEYPFTENYISQERKIDFSRNESFSNHSNINCLPNKNFPEKENINKNGNAFSEQNKFVLNKYRL